MTRDLEPRCRVNKEEAPVEAEAAPDWLTLPDLIFIDMMMMVGLKSLESLHRCRQVCKSWNEMILRDIWPKKIMKERIERRWGPGMFPSDEDISDAKWRGNDHLLLKFIVNTILLLL